MRISMANMIFCPAKYVVAVSLRGGAFSWCRGLPECDYALFFRNYIIAPGEKYRKCISMRAIEDPNDDDLMSAQMQAGIFR